MTAFEKNFDYCDFYFFPSHYTGFLMRRQFDSVYYYGPDLTIDSSIRPKINTFFVAEFAEIESDTTTYIAGKELYPSDTGKKIIRNIYVEEGVYRFEALLIRSDKFVQLAKPFPYYSRTYDGWRKPPKVVRRMNKKLYKYYEEVIYDENEQQKKVAEKLTIEN